MQEMKILRDVIPVSDDLIEIDKLKFLTDNPRVYAVVYSEPNFEDESPDEQQKIIYDKLSQEPSVKNLKPDIQRHGGLMEPILVRWDRMEVIEGNSRLAVYRQLHEQYPDQDWGLIHCNIVKELTELQQAAFLSQIHVKGKTQWSAYEKANFAYVRYERKMEVEDIAELLRETSQEIQKRIDVIEMIKENNDTKRRHFSYYDVIVRNPDILNAIKNNKLPNLLSDIKNLGSDEENNDFNALDMRKKLPAILRKSNVLKKYNAKTIDLDEAYQRAKTSRVEDKVKKATGLISDVSIKEIKSLEKPRFDALKQHVNKLARASNRLSDMAKEIDK